MRPQHFHVYAIDNACSIGCCTYLLEISHLFLTEMKELEYTAARIEEAMSLISGVQVRENLDLPSSQPNLRMTHTLL